MFKRGQTGGARADGDGLSHGQKAGSIDGETPPHPVHVEKYLIFEVILRKQ